MRTLPQIIEDLTTTGEMLREVEGDLRAWAAMLGLAAVGEGGVGVTAPRPTEPRLQNGGGGMAQEQGQGPGGLMRFLNRGPGTYSRNRKFPTRDLEPGEKERLLEDWDNFPPKYMDVRAVTLGEKYQLNRSQLAALIRCHRPGTYYQGMEQEEGEGS